MVELNFDEETEPGEIDSDTPEDAFMRGYSEEEKVDECAECGCALKEKKVTKEIEGEVYRFCSEDCLEDFEDSL